MKKLFWILIVLILVGCVSSKKYDVIDESMDEHRVLDTQEVELVISEINQYNLSLAIINKTSQSYLYGEYFSLEVKTKTGYKTLKMKDNTGFRDIGYSLKAQESVLSQLQLLDYYDQILPGEYRLIKPIFTQQNDLRYLVDYFSWS